MTKIQRISMPFEGSVHVLSDAILKVISLHRGGVLYQSSKNKDRYYWTLSFSRLLADVSGVPDSLLKRYVVLEGATILNARGEFLDFHSAVIGPGIVNNERWNYQKVDRILRGYWLLASNGDKYFLRQERGSGVIAQNDVRNIPVGMETTLSQLEKKEQLQHFIQSHNESRTVMRQEENHKDFNYFPANALHRENLQDIPYYEEGDYWV